MSLNVTAVKPDQQLALELVPRGFNDVEIAKVLNVRRKTIWQWRHHDLTFRAVLQEQQAVMLDSTAGRLHGIAEQAASVLLNSLHSSKLDPRLAMPLLSSLGLFERSRDMGKREEESAGGATVREAEREDEVERVLDAVEVEAGGGERRLRAGGESDARLKSGGKIAKPLVC